MIKKVKNPETDRWISIGGPTYNDLVSRGVVIKSQKIKETRAFQPKSSDEYYTPRQFKQYPVDRGVVSWGLKKPEKVGQMKKIYEECGDSCFLYRKNKELKFPICNKELPCTYNCKGLKAASSRAGEWKYEKVLKTSKKLTQDLGCYVGKRKK